MPGRPPIKNSENSGPGRPLGATGEKRKALDAAFAALEKDGKHSPEAVLAKLYEMAAAGDVGAIREYHDRRFGKPLQSVEVSGDSSLAAEAQAARELLELRGKTIVAVAVAKPN